MRRITGTLTTEYRKTARTTEVSYDSSIGKQKACTNCTERHFEYKCWRNACAFGAMRIVFLLAHLIAKKDTIVGNLFKLITVLTLLLSVGIAIGFWG